MKTPRDILLAHHNDATPRLDELRRVVMTQLGRKTQPAGEGALVRGLTVCWRELIWPCRQIWTGLAVIWGLVLVVNLASMERSNPRFPASLATVEMRMALRKQEKLLEESISDRPLPITNPRSGTATPNQRSEISGRMAA